ncbi:MAG: hypothetical protein M1814_000492 [Vezdaea aestivalis]|nr:MAG: hypothetical protein M1814_000492 [Vezdaea aestivalis]
MSDSHFRPVDERSHTWPTGISKLGHSNDRKGQGTTELGKYRGRESDRDRLGEREGNYEAENLQKKNEDLAFQVAILTTGKDKSDRELEENQREREEWKTQSKSYKSLIEKLREENESLKLRLGQSVARAKKLSAIIIGKGEDKEEDKEEPDELVAKAFRSLRSAIQLVAHVYCTANPIDAALLRTKLQIEKFSNWSNLTPELRRYGTKALVFEIVQEQYFSYPCFGLDPALEKQLIGFDVGLQNKHVDSVDLANWRRQTTSLAIQLGKDQYDHSSFWKKFSEILSPIMGWQEANEEIREQEKSQTWTALRNISAKALELRLIMGKSSAVFSFEAISVGTEMDESEESTMNVVYRGKDSEKTAVVCSTVFGVLYKLKSASDEKNDAIVIEKAEAMCW